MTSENPEPKITNHQSPAPEDNILVWLPSPMGDAILCTPALRALRRRFKSSRITFFANPVARQILSPGRFNDIWLPQQSRNPVAIAKKLKDHKFTNAILFKNSFASALAAFLAKIPSRIGYARQCRGFMLTDKLYPPKKPDGKFEPISMLDYYLAIASSLGCAAAERNLELLVDPKDKEKLKADLPGLADYDGPLVIFVPGGAFGPSKCWPTERFAKTADWLIDNYNARIVVSVSSAPQEKKIAQEICASSTHKLINLADSPLSLGELKALFSIAALVISNDTGPRHIAIALKCKLITLFGPNDPRWTDTGFENEIKLIGDAPCAPCQKPVCREKQHLCMEAITVEMVCGAAKKLLDDSKSTLNAGQKFIEISNLSRATCGEHRRTMSRESFFIDPDYKTAFSKLGLTSIDAVFSFNAGINLAKNNLAAFRNRLKFETNSPPATLFLKRYLLPPIIVQLKNWLSSRRRISFGLGDHNTANALAAAGINTPKTIAYGEHRGLLFEKRSFIVTEKIPNADSLERKLPDYFTTAPTIGNLKLQRDFIAKLAAFVKKFHQTGYCHRDLYFSHIFYGVSGEFYLIDLSRAFKPFLFTRRFRIKDIAQLYYSAPRTYFSGTDRLRFYLGYTDSNKMTPHRADPLSARSRPKADPLQRSDSKTRASGAGLTKKDKIFIAKVINKAKRMARHDIKHKRHVHFEY